VRARELGLAIGIGKPGPHNAITDIAGVRVGHETLVDGDAVRTGVTVIFPHEGDPGADPVFAGCHRLNGNGELTGLEWVRESGLLTTPVGLTNTHSVGVVRDALIAWSIRTGLMRDDEWSLPVVGETWDGTLNDINGLHVKPEHVFAAIESADGGAVAEGNVGSGTGMICHGFKGGIGTASRVLAAGDGGYTVGVLVQANHGARERLQIEGAAVGRELGPDRVPLPRDSGPPPGGGSIIVVVATDAPLLPHQLDRVAQRAGLGVARLGGAGENGSGDIFIAFSTANRGLAGLGTRSVEMLGNDAVDPIFYATIAATEEAIVNAMLQAETMTGKGGATAHRLEPDLLMDVMRRAGASGQRAVAGG
jgi:D-aminopeptidase